MIRFMIDPLHDPRERPHGRRLRVSMSAFGAGSRMRGGRIRPYASLNFNEIAAERR